MDGPELLEDLAEKLNGRYERATVELLRTNNPIVYLNFNDNLDNTLSIYLDGGNFAITNFRYLNSNDFKTETVWTERRNITDPQGLESFVNSCYTRLKNENQEIENGLQESFEQAGSSLNELKALEGDNPIGRRTDQQQTNQTSPQIPQDIRESYSQFQTALREKRYIDARDMLDSGNVQLRRMVTPEEYKTLNDGEMYDEDSIEENFEKMNPDQQYETFKRYLEAGNYRRVLRFTLRGNNNIWTNKITDQEHQKLFEALRLTRGY